MDEPPKTPSELMPKPTTKEITLTDLMKHAEPLVKLWTESENEKQRSELEYQKSELEYQNNLLQATERQNRLVTIGLFIILGLFVIIAGGLFLLGRDSSAMDLIKLIVGLGGATLGGYGWAMARRRTEEDEL